MSVRAWWWRLVLVVVVAVVVGGCAWADRVQQRADELNARNQAEADRVAKQIQAIPGVVTGGVSYSYAPLTNSRGGVIVTVDVRRGVDKARVADRAVELVWRSHIDPLDDILITVGAESDDPLLAHRLSYDLDEAFVELERQYGPRPVPQKNKR